MPTDPVTVAYLHKDEVGFNWHHSLMNLLMFDASGEQRIIRGGYIAFRSSYELSMSRNAVVKQFLEDIRSDWLFFIDTDMGFDPDALERLMTHADPTDRPIVSGLCFGWRDIGPDGLSGMTRRPFPTAFRWNEFDGQAAFASLLHYPANDLIAVDGVGSAFIVIHRSVFEKLGELHGPHWYDQIPNPTMAEGAKFGEDLSFCIKAKAAGFPLHVHTGIKTNHWKNVFVSEAEFWHYTQAPPATERVAVIVPVLGRPQNAQPFMDSLRASTGLAEVVAVADTGDTATIDAWTEAGAIVVTTGDRTSFAEKVNDALHWPDDRPPPWLFICGDDVTFRPGWYDQAFQTAGVTGAHVIGTNDLANPRVVAGDHATHLLIRRSYIIEQGASWDGPGIVCHEGYRHWYVDDEIVRAAKDRGVWAMSLGSVVEHHHPTFDPDVPFDDTYRLGQSWADEDRKTFGKRLGHHAVPA